MSNDYWRKTSRYIWLYFSLLGDCIILIILVIWALLTGFLTGDLKKWLKE